MSKLRLTKDVGVHELALIHEACKFCFQTLDGFLVLVMLILPVLKDGVLLGNLRLKILDLFVRRFLNSFEGLLVKLEDFLALLLQHLNLIFQDVHILVNFKDLLGLDNFFCKGQYAKL